MINFVILELKLHVYIVMLFKFHEKSYMKGIPCGNNTLTHLRSLHVISFSEEVSRISCMTTTRPRFRSDNPHKQIAFLLD